MLVTRDPFARTELHKDCIANHGDKDCDWCGQTPARLYRYRSESDGGRSWSIKGTFCSKTCMESYHGG